MLREKMKIFLSRLFIYLILLNPLFGKNMETSLSALMLSSILSFGLVSLFVEDFFQIMKASDDFSFCILRIRGRPDEPGLKGKMLDTKDIVQNYQTREIIFYNFLLHFDRMKTLRKCVQDSANFPRIDLTTLQTGLPAPAPAATRELSPPCD